jgi:uroporphyrinogen-III synthase
MVLKPVAGAAAGLDGVGAVALTSVNAAPLLAAATPVRDRPVFVVGEATAAAARAAGFTDVWSADGDVEALARLIVSTWSPARGAVLHAGAREPAGDLGGALAAAGIEARALVLYDTEAVADVDAGAVEGVDAVLVHSPKAARALAGLAAGELRLRRPVALALSEACAGPLREAGFAPVAAAEFPKEEALLKLLSDMPAHARHPDALLDHDPKTARRRRLGWTFWAGILFGLVCIFLGAVVGVWGSRIFPPPLDPPPAVLPAEPPAGPAGPGAAAGRFDPASDTYALEQRLAQVEAEARVRGEAAAGALAVANLAQAAERSTPFDDQVQAYAGVLPATADAQALKELAAVGAPTRAELTAGFADAAARAAAAQRQAEAGQGFFARFKRLLASVVSVRRVDRFTGPGTDAVLARAERAVGRGDLAGAVRELAALPPAARVAAGPWRDGAGRRLAIETRLAGLRAAALARLRPALAPEPAPPAGPVPGPPSSSTPEPGVGG